MIRADEMLQRLSLQAPYLMIDKVIDLVPGHSLTAVKLLSANEVFFPAHFPGYPVMPGVMIIEAFTQAAALFFLASLEEKVSSLIPVFGSCETARFRRPVMVGDALIVQVTLLKKKGRFLKTKIMASVEDVLVADAVMTTTLSEKTSVLSEPACLSSFTHA